jgi:hypothetical protein
MILLLFLFFFFASPIVAQNTGDLFTQYKTDYLFQKDEYQNNYLDYLNKKNVYIQYRTITSEKDKIQSTKNVLFSQNKMLKSFLMAIRVGLDKYENINPTDTEKHQIQIKKWEEWTDEQNLIIPNLNNSTDLQNWTTTFKSRYIEIQQVIYSALTQANINLRLYNLNEIKLLADIIRSNPKYASNSDDWFANFSVRSDLINTSLQQASAIAQKPQRTKTFSNFYPDVRVEINRADTYIKSLLVDLKAVTIETNNQ